MFKISIVSTSVLLVLCLYFLTVSCQYDRGSIASNPALQRLAENVNSAYRKQDLSEEISDQKVLASKSHHKHGKSKSHSVPIKKSYSHAKSDEHAHSQRGLHQSDSAVPAQQGGVPPEYEKYIPEPYRKYAHPPSESSAPVVEKSHHGKSGKGHKGHKVAFVEEEELVDETVQNDAQEESNEQEDQTYEPTNAVEAEESLPEVQSNKVLADVGLASSGQYSVLYILCAALLLSAVAFGGYLAYGKALASSEYQSVPTREVY